MKLQEIRAENFGVFRDRRFEFGDDGFALVYGPNEAGKSTLLQLLRESLFGFPHNSQYAVDSGAMAAEVEATLRDGSRLLFRRRKGLKKVVEGRIEPSGASVDETKLAALLGHASSSLYHNVFAFSLTELGSGAASFASAGLTLTEALFGGSVGGLANLPRVKKQLREECESLFKPTAKKLPINELLAKLKEDKKRLKDAVVKPTKYVELEEQLAALKKRIGEQQKAQHATAAQLAHLQRLDNAWEHYGAQQAAQGELNELNVPATLLPGDAQRCESLEDLLVDLEAQVKQTGDALVSVERERASLKVSVELIDSATAIKGLEQEIGKIEGFLRDLPEREKELAGAESRMKATLKSIHPDWTREDLAERKLGLNHRDHVRQLVEQARAMDSARKAIAEELEQLEPVVKRQRSRLENMSEDLSIDQLAEVLAQEGRFSAERQSIRQHDKREAQLLAELEQLQARLQVAVPQLPAELANLHPPMVAAVEEFRDQWAAFDKQQSTLTDRMQAATDELRTIRDKLLNLDAAGAVPERSLLDAARERRDAGWKLIRRQYIEGQNCDARIAAWLSDPLESLPEEFTRSMQHADQLADDRQRYSDKVAQKELLLEQERSLASRVEELRGEAAVQSRTREEADARWRQLWQPCQVVPQSPGVMLEWMRLFETWQQRAVELRDLQSSRADSQLFCTGFEGRLREVIGDASSAIDRVIHQARQRTDAAKNLRGQRQELVYGLQENEERLQELHANEVKLDQSQKDWHDAWQALLKQLDLTPDWRIAAVEQLLAGIEQAASDDRIAQDLRRRVDDMQTESDEFDKASRTLAKKVAPALASLPMVERVRQMAALASEAQAANAHAIALGKEAERLSQEKSAKENRLKDVREQRQALWQQVGAQDSVDYRRLTKDAGRRDQLLEEVRSSQRAISVAREHELEAEFLAALAQLNRDTQRQQREDLQRALDELSRSIDELNRDSGKLEHELAQLYQEGEALAIQQQIESQRSQLRDHVERWTALALAEKVLERALEQFQREHQDDVLAEARRLFCQLTGGKHVDIRRGFGETFTAVDIQGDERRPDQLSRGTQEQLYLAFRLAFVKHYCRDREPLPFVMDDVLVNFDPERAAYTMEALLDLSQHVQIIFLTCHPTTVDMIRQHAPDCTLIELAGDREVAKV